MLKWFRRYLAWLCVAIALAGVVLISIGWMRQAHVAAVMAEGQDAVAVIERAQSFARKQIASFEINLAWSDRDGKVRRAKDVPITSGFADKIIADGVLLVPSTKIRYLANDSARLPVVADDSDAQLTAARQLQILGVAGLLLGIAGALLFGRRWRWRLAL